MRVGHFPSQQASDHVSRHENVVEILHWHQTILDEREQLATQGKARFLDWDAGDAALDRESPDSPANDR